MKKTHLKFKENHAIRDFSGSLVFISNRRKNESEVIQCDQGKTDLTLAEVRSALAGDSSDNFIVKFLADEKFYNELKGLFDSLGLDSKGKVLDSDKVYELHFEGGSGRMKIGRNVKTSSQTVDRTVENSSSVKKVLIVDDSPTIRKILRSAINQMEGYSVVAETGNPTEVTNLVLEHQPDLMTLDIHMPEMDGVETLEVLFKTTFVPTIVVSSLSIEQGTKVLDALELGALDYLQKPSMERMSELKCDLEEKFEAAATHVGDLRKKTKTVTARAAISVGDKIDPRRIIAIGSSTGGTEAVRDLLTALPAQMPPIIVAQHIPPHFSKAFADRLCQTTCFDVKEAEDGDELLPGHVLVAPGGKHCQVVEKGGRFFTRLLDADFRKGHVPSVDVLFESVAKVVGRRAVGIILTGMGRDGASGMLEMRNVGSHTMAQDEETSVVYGMPKAAVEINAAVNVWPLNKLGQGLLDEITLKFAESNKKAS